MNTPNHAETVRRLQEQLVITQNEAGRLREELTLVHRDRDELHRNLTTARTALADMERQRDEALNRASALEDEYADSDGQWKDATGLLVGGDPDGVTPGHLRRHIQRADRTIAAWKRCAKKYRAMVRGYEEAVTKPRERVEPSSGSPLPRIELMKGSVWTAKGMQERLNGTDWLPRMEVLTAVGDLEAEISTLRARAEKAEQELEQSRYERMTEIDMLRADLSAAQIERDRMQAELARFQRADVGERVRHMESVDVEASNFSRRMALNDRAELLSIVRQQAAANESLELQMSDVDRLHAIVERQTRELAEYRRHLSAIRERVENLQCWMLYCTPTLSPYMKGHPEGDYLKRSEVLAALEPGVKDSLTTEQPSGDSEELPRPIPGCKYIDKDDGTCGHPNAITAECHVHAPCPERRKAASEAKP